MLEINRPMSKTTPVEGIRAAAAGGAPLGSDGRKSFTADESAGGSAHLRETSAGMERNIKNAGTRVVNSEQLRGGPASIRVTKGEDMGARNEKPQPRTNNFAPASNVGQMPAVNHTQTVATSANGAPASASTINRAPTAAGKSGGVQNSSLFSRIKKIKHIEIYAAVVVVAVMVLIYLTSFAAGSSNKAIDQIAANEDTFAREMEQSLMKTLGAVQGAGKVNAMVTVASSATIEIAYNIDEKTITQGGSGSSTTTTTIIKTPVIINGKNGPQPLILLEIKPKLKGVVIVASGANDITVRMNLLRAVQALISDNTVKIEIFAGK